MQHVCPPDPCWNELPKTACSGQLGNLKADWKSGIDYGITARFPNSVRGFGHAGERPHPQEMHTLALRGELNWYLQLNLCHSGNCVWGQRQTKHDNMLAGAGSSAYTGIRQTILPAFLHVSSFS